MTDLAWFQIYFQEAPDEASRWVGAIREVLPPNDTTAIRLQGWLDLVSDHPQEAYKALASIQERDPLAKLGILRMTARGMVKMAQPTSGPSTRPVVVRVESSKDAVTPGDQELNIRVADDIGRRLLGRNPTGLVAALLSAALKDRKLDPERPPMSAAIAAELTRTREPEHQPIQDWVRIAETPTNTGGPGKFYIVTVQPWDSVRQSPKAAYHVGEPLMARVTIQNISNYDISIGPGGTISQDLWFTAEIGTLDVSTRSFPTAAYDRIANAMVLKARTNCTQTIEIDQGKMVNVLREKPAGTLTVEAKVITNPTLVAGHAVPGPAGLIRQFDKRFVRTSAAMNDLIQRKKALEGLTGLPSSKMLTIDTMAAHIVLARQPKAEGQGDILALSSELTDQLQKMKSDPIPDVAGWAEYTDARVGPAGDAQAKLLKLAAAPNWEVRILAGVGATEMPPEIAKPVAAVLAKDSTPMVATLGSSILDDLAHPATQPTTAPSAEPPAPDAAGPKLPTP